MSSVQIILLRDLPNLGNLGDVVKVKRGYARNHLLPTGMAQLYTKENWDHFAKIKEEIIKQQKESRAAIEQMHSQLNGYILQSVVRAGDDGQLYGSISQSTVVDLLREQDYQVKRNQIRLPDDEPIKQIGEHEITVTLAGDLVATIHFSVLSERDA